jgi:urate oxidase
MTDSFLSAARYGKDKVRVLRVKRDPSNPSKQDVLEMVVRVLLEGEIDESYTRADNGPIVPTDTVKNTIYIIAKLQDVWPIERYAAVLAHHFVTKYSHIHKCHVDIKQLKWSRYQVNGKLHDHSFVRDGLETRFVSLSKSDKSGYEIQSGMTGLKVLKSTGSMFYGYHKCDFTTLKETTDRILSTDVNAEWVWNPSSIKTLDQVHSLANNGVFDHVYDSANRITLERFALENSASVQATMYNMASDILSISNHVKDVSYELPNNHYFEINLDWHHNLPNTGLNAEVYAPQSDPSGLIRCTVSSKSRSKL